MDDDSFDDDDLDDDEQYFPEIPETVQEIAALWLRSRGLESEIDAARGHGPTRRRAPGLHAINAAIVERTRRALEIGERAWSLDIFEDVDEARELDEELLAIVGDLLVLHRRLAQLLLGVNAIGSDIDRVELIDRSATWVIHLGQTHGADLLSDGFESASHDIDDLRVELAGLISRMILEKSWSIDVHTTDDVREIVWAGGHLILRIGDNIETWRDPMVVLEVVDHALADLTEQVQLAIRSAPDDE